MTRVREQKEMAMAKKGNIGDFEARIIISVLIAKGRYPDAMNDILLKHNKSNNAPNC